MQHTSYLWALWSFPISKGPLFQLKLNLLSTVLFNGFQSSPLSASVPGKLHGSSEHSECNFLQDQDNFYRSRAWQIALIFNIARCKCIILQSASTCLFQSAGNLYLLQQASFYQNLNLAIIQLHVTQWFNIKHSNGKIITRSDFELTNTANFSH